MPNVSAIAARIASERDRLRLTQAQLGALVGVHRVTVAKWEAGEQIPYRHLEALSTAFGRDVVWILGENQTLEELARSNPAALQNLIGKKELADIEKALQHVQRLSRSSGVNMQVPERRPKRINRRDELAVYRIAKEAKGHKLPQWLNLACGPGMELEKSPDFIYVEMPGRVKGIHSAVVRGDSMTDTLSPGDIVILEEFNGGEIKLEPLGDDPKNSYRMLQARIPDEAICVISINRDPPTLKRVIYDTSRGAADWTLLFVADNALEWKPRPVGRNEEITFWAKLIGLAKMDTRKPD